MSDFNATEKDVPSKVKELSDRVSELQKKIAKLESQCLESNHDVVIERGRPFYICLFKIALLD